MDCPLRRTPLAQRNNGTVNHGDYSAGNFTVPGINPVTACGLLLAGALSVVAWVEHGTISELEQDNQTLRRARDTAVWQLEHTHQTLSLLNTLSRTGRDEKQQNTQQLETQRQAIRPALAQVPAAAVVVPGDVARRVRDAVNSIRQRAPRPASR